MPVLVAMSSVYTTPEGSDAVQVHTLRQWYPRHVLVDRVYSAVETVRDRNENTWPPDRQHPRRTQSLTAELSVLTYVLTECDFVPRLCWIHSLKI